MHDHDDSQSEPAVPAKLADALRQISRQPIDTRELDTRVLACADRLGSPSSFPIRLSMGRLVGLGGALAAGLALAMVFWPQLSQPRSASLAQSSIANDFDRDGRVTVLDAYLVARGVRDGTVDPAWDADASGTVNLSDADAIAQLAVLLEPADSAPTSERLDSAGAG